MCNLIRDAFFIVSMVQQRSHIDKHVDKKVSIKKVAPRSLQRTVQHPVQAYPLPH
jgi:hypothetical protein